MDKKFIEDVYNTLQGLLVDPIPGVENAFEEGSLCEKSYGEMLDAYERLRRRLGVENEDVDVEIIIDSLMTITKELCCLMYKYGAKLK